MMSTKVKSSKMENSTILRDIAELDIKAPISVSVTFDDDELDDKPIKTEIETDDYQEEDQVTTISAFFSAPATNPGTKTKTVTNEQKNKVIEPSAHQPESLQNRQSNDDNFRKRKAENVPMCESKKKVTSDITDKNNVHEEYSSQTFSHVNVPTLAASENLKKGLVVATNDSNESDINLGVNGLQQTDIDKINSYITNCLAALSENMRHIIQAYGAYKRQQITSEDFVKIKYLNFHRSYKIVLTILIPEENNVEFINTFLNDTVHRAQKNSGFMYGYQDYSNLLNEMYIWTKKKQALTQQINFSEVSNEVSKHSTSIQNSVIIPSKPNRTVPQDQRNDNSQYTSSNTNTTSDKVCIFSAGPPERSVRINIDPLLNKSLQVQNNTADRNQPLCKASDNNLKKPASNDKTTHSKTADEYFPGFVGNSNNPVPQFLQWTAPKIPSQITSQPQKYPMSNYNIPPQQTKAHPTNLQSQLETPTLLNYLTQPIQSQRPPPHQFEHSQNFKPQTPIQPPPPYDQSWHLQVQSGQQQQLQSQYAPAVQAQSPQIQFQQSQYFQHQSGPQFAQPQELQRRLDHSQVPVIQYSSNQARQLQVPHQANMQSSQQGPHQYRQQPNSQATQHWPSMIDLLSTSQPNASNESRTGQLQSKNQQLNQQIHPYVAHQTEWHQGLNAIYQAGQAPPLTQKGSPRSASTDSGFISPLNFNVSSDQPMPTVPQDPETPMPMIVHVTSLSDKAAFLELGKCVVCKKNTKQMCMGCMKIYYCTYQCQSSDWATHAPHCKQNT